MEKSALKLADDLCLTEDKFLGKDKYFMFSEQKNKYLKITREQYYFFKAIFPYMNGTFTEEEIAEQFEKDTGKTADIQKLVHVINGFGLFQDSERDDISKIEMELYGKKLKHIELTGLQNKFNKFFKVLYIIMYLSLIVLSAWFMYAMYENGFSIRELLIKCKLDWSKVNFLQFIYIYLLSLIGMIIHELGHFIAACFYNVSVKSVTLLLRFGLMPSFYVRYNKLYQVKSSVRVKILIAGVMMNILQAGIFFAIYLATGKWEYMILLILNASAVTANLSPLSQSDGYQISSIILNMEGFRWRLIRKLGLVLNRTVGFKSLFCMENLIYLAYAVISCAITFRIFYVITITTIRVINFSFIENQNIKIIAVSFIFISIIFYLYKFFKNILKFKS